MPTFLERRIKIDDLILREVKEGQTIFFVPDPLKYQRNKSDYLPTTLPVFYNPQAEVSRDSSVLIISAFMKLYCKSIKRVTYVEALAGTGARGFRVLNEAYTADKISVILNDINPLATKVMKTTYDHYFRGKPIRIYEKDANLLLNELHSLKIRPEIIEIDPPGTPAPFLFSAIRSIKIGGLLIVTATDTSCLYGKFPESALRKYGVYIIENPFSKEIGVRALLYAIGREASKVSRYIQPVFSFATHNFVRVAVIVGRSKTRANNFWTKEIGWVSFCPACLYFQTYIGFDKLPFDKSCPRDSTKMCHIGPIYLGKIYDEKFVSTMLELLPQMPFNKASQRFFGKCLKWMLESSHIILYYSIREIARRLHISIPPIESIISILKRDRYVATRTHFDETGIKTNAPIEKVYNAILSA